MNAYVAGGWGATAVMLALYAARTLWRGRVLTRALAHGPLCPPEVPGNDEAGEAAEPAGSAEVQPWP
jgi:hypothetical protein